MSALPPKRRWFRFSFSLWTLFVSFTIFCLILGWIISNLNWIRQRRAIADPEPGRRLWRWPAPKGRAPGTLWLFGETGWQNLQLYCETEEEAARMRKRAQQLFPEAKLSVTVRKHERRQSQ
jgi:hypothetical protein